MLFLAVQLSACVLAAALTSIRHMFASAEGFDMPEEVIIARLMMPIVAYGGAGDRRRTCPCISTVHLMEQSHQALCAW